MKKTKEKNNFFFGENQKKKACFAPGYNHESRNTTPHAINGLVEVKKASFPPFSTTPYVLAHTGSRASNNRCARVAGAQSLTCACSNMH
jgi:hypothetical protein